MAVELESSDALVIKPVLCITITFISVIPKFFGVLKAKPSDPLCVSLPLYSTSYPATLYRPLSRTASLPSRTPHWEILEYSVHCPIKDRVKTYLSSSAIRHRWVLLETS
ncbi:hypothetical protein RAB80_010777 [Fusarium oxysporum f. sp. vasinfectum]|nr:hypothetical protein RAB80_010777 [Fusarium oxysporum f. sp. vasinfectum]